MSRTPTNRDRKGVGLLLCLCLALQAATSPDELIEQAHKSHSPRDSEARLRKALQLWDTSGSTDTAEYANALVLLGLLTRGREKDASGKMASDVGPLAEQAIRICEKQTCPEDTFPLALELLSGVLSATSDEAGAQAAAARAFRLRNLPDGPPFPPKSGPSPRGAQKAGGAITAPRISFQRQPEFCEAARWARREGEVVLQIIVNSDGTPRVTKVVRPLGFGLDEKAVEAVSQWRFIPGTKAGAPVNAMASIVVTFRLL